VGIVRYRLDPSNPPRFAPEQRARLDALTDEEIERNAREDPDNPPLTDEQLDRAVFVRDLSTARKASGLSQAEFAKRYRINLARLRDWEQGRFQPDSVAMAYVRVIAREAAAVDRALAAAE
jgi:putative transcriptional regulator